MCIIEVPHSCRGISHSLDKGVSSFGTGADGVSPASMEPPGITTLVCGSWVTVESIIKVVSKLYCVYLNRTQAKKIIFTILNFVRFSGKGHHALH